MADECDYVSSAWGAFDGPHATPVAARRRPDFLNISGLKSAAVLI